MFLLVGLLLLAPSLPRHHPAICHGLTGKQLRVRADRHLHVGQASCLHPVGTSIWLALAFDCTLHLSPGLCLLSHNALLRMNRRQGLRTRPGDQKPESGSPVPSGPGTRHYCATSRGSGPPCPSSHRLRERFLPRQCEAEPLPLLPPPLLLFATNPAWNKWSEFTTCCRASWGASRSAPLCALWVFPSPTHGLPAACVLRWHSPCGKHAKSQRGLF